MRPFLIYQANRTFCRIKLNLVIKGCRCDRFAVPYTLATALGLGALALDLPLSAAEVANGLVPPAVAYHVRTL